MEINSGKATSSGAGFLQPPHSAGTTLSYRSCSLRCLQIHVPGNQATHHGNYPDQNSVGWELFQLRTKGILSSLSAVIPYSAQCKSALGTVSQVQVPSKPVRTGNISVAIAGFHRPVGGRWSDSQLDKQTYFPSILLCNYHSGPIIYLDCTSDMLLSAQSLL